MHILTTYDDIDPKPFIISLYLISFFNLLIVDFAITMGKGIIRIYKHSQWNWIYTSPNTDFLRTQRPGTSTKTRSTIACGASVGAHDL